MSDPIYKRDSILSLQSELRALKARTANLEKALISIHQDLQDSLDRTHKMVLLILNNDDILNG
jgi:hypothetical protein